jgi:hypothetical protein
MLAMSMMLHRIGNVWILQSRKPTGPLLYRDSIKSVIGLGIVHELRFVNPLLFAGEERPLHTLVDF